MNNFYGSLPVNYKGSPLKNNSFETFSDHQVVVYSRGNRYNEEVISRNVVKNYTTISPKLNIYFIINDQKGKGIAKARGLTNRYREVFLIDETETSFLNSIGNPKALKASEIEDAVIEKKPKNKKELNFYSPYDHEKGCFTYDIPFSEAFAGNSKIYYLKKDGRLWSQELKKSFTLQEIKDFIKFGHEFNLIPKKIKIFIVNKYETKNKRFFENKRIVDFGSYFEKKFKSFFEKKEIQGLLKKHLSASNIVNEVGTFEKNFLNKKEIINNISPDSYFNQYRNIINKYKKCIEDTEDTEKYLKIKKVSNILNFSIMTENVEIKRLHEHYPMFLYIDYSDFCNGDDYQPIIDYINFIDRKEKNG